MALSLLLAAGIATPRAAQAQQTLLQPRQPAAVPRPQLGTAKWCAEYRVGEATAVSMQDPAQLRRLQAAQAELAPGFQPGTRRDGLRLLASYQQELERLRPDPSVAATYLALTSTVPLSLPEVERVNALLCVSSPRRFAAAVASAAEAQRQELAR